MFVYYFYILLLLVMFLMSFGALSLSRSAPIKIKSIGMMLSLIMFMRYTALIFMLLNINIKYLYPFKPLYFLNIYFMPVAAVTVLYIFLRNDKLNFSYTFLIAGILIVFYYAAMIMNAASLRAVGIYGYIMRFEDSPYIYWAYLIFNTAVFFGSILLLNTKNAIKTGLILSMVVSCTAIVETLLSFMGIMLFPENIIGDILWMITLVYALRLVNSNQTPVTRLQ